LLIEYPLWRIWTKKGTPLNELKYQWTYPDILKALAIMDMEDDYDCAIEGYQKVNTPND
jgi:hypothetical protein